MADFARDAWTVLRGAFAEARADRLSTTAQALAYSLFLAIPATLLVVLGVFSLVADADDIAGLIERVDELLPAEASSLLQDSLERSAESDRGGIVLTIAGFVLALWTLSSAATTLMQSLTSTYDREDTRGFVRTRLIGLAIVFALVAGAALVFGLLVLGPFLERWIGSALELESVTSWLWWVAQWPVLVGGLLFAFAVVLYLGPDVEQPRWGLVTPGAVTALVVWLVASGAFAVYAASFGSYEKTW